MYDIGRDLKTEMLVEAQPEQQGLTHLRPQ